MDTFGSRSTLRVGSTPYDFYRISSLDKHGFTTARLPYSLRILLENLLRREDDETVTAEMIRALAGWTSKTASEQEISFMPSRVLMQDFTRRGGSGSHA
jgi:aconitate hydratase